MTTPAIPLRERPPGRIVRAAALAAAAVAVGVGIGLLASSPWNNGTPAGGGPSKDAIRAFEEQTGVRVLRVAVTGQGGIVDLRYEIVAEHPPVMHDPSQHPAILDRQTGEVIGEPFMGMWHKHEFAEPGDVVYQLFVNRQGLIEPGEQVAVRLGGAVLNDVPVE